MNEQERRLLEDITSYQRHLGETLADCLAAIVDVGETHKQTALTLSSVTNKLAETVDRISELEHRLGRYLTDQAKYDSGVRAVDQRLREHLAEEHGKR